MRGDDQQQKEQMRIWVIIILSYFMASGRFSHVVAGAVQTFYIAMTCQSGWGGVLATYVAPTFLGNVIGGVAVVAAINHAQVVCSKPKEVGDVPSAEYSKATT